MRLLDSNIFILGARRDGPPFASEVFEEPYAFSIVTKIEVLGFHRLLEEDRIDLQEMLEGGKEIDLTAAIASTAIQLRQARRMSLGDAIIAATALAYALPLVTRNWQDFQRVPGLELIPE